MKQRPDPSERDNGGGLFSPQRVGPPPVTHLHTADDPETSRRAAVTALASGRVAGDAFLLLSLITDHPGETMAEYGQRAADLYGGDPFAWRIRLGRRTGTLRDGGHAHMKGERDGLGRWWTGPDPRKEKEAL